jgi:predicted amidohydrolase
MQLVGVQLDIVWEDRQANHEKVRALLAANPPARGALVALPEMFASGFSMNVEKIAEAQSRLTETFLCEIAKEYGIYLVAGLATKTPDGRGQNEALVADPSGKTIARYRKIHPYSPGKEKDHFVGGEAIELFQCGGGLRVSPFVCYDLRFPEAFRAAMQRGAQVLIVIANWPSYRVEHWRTLLRARAIENQAYVLGVNRCGKDPYLPYPGGSMIVDYRGNVLADAGDEEGTIHADADLAPLLAYRKELPFLADMKRDLGSLFQ